MKNDFLKLSGLIERTVPIIDVVSKYMPLRATSSGAIGICPFHDDTKPSLNIHRERNFYHCFSCKASGGVVRFVEEMGKVSREEAILSLCEEFEIAALPLSPEQKETIDIERDRKNGILDKLEKAAQRCQETLFTPDGKRALSLLEERGISRETINLFRLGYSSSKGSYTKKIGLEEAFTDRIIFPITSNNGVVVAFGGRILSGERAKYINSPESEFFSKKKFFYGFNDAKREISRTGKVILCEGYFDILALHQNGFRNSLATMGTSLSDEHIKTLSRFSTPEQHLEIVINLDGDRAGDVATHKVIDSLEPFIGAGMFSCRGLSLEAGSDPADYIHRQDEYRALLDGAPSSSMWKINQILATVEAGDTESLRTSILKTRATLATCMSFERVVLARHFARSASFSDIKLEEEIHREISRPIPLKSRSITNKKGKGMNINETELFIIQALITLKEYPASIFDRLPRPEEFASFRSRELLREALLDPRSVALPLLEMEEAEIAPSLELCLIEHSRKKQQELQTFYLNLWADVPHDSEEAEFYLSMYSSLCVAI